MLQASIFRDLSASDISELLPGLIERSFVRGEVVWLAGEPADVLVVLAEGQLKVHRINSDGREVIVDVVTAVATTGEVGLFHPAGSRWLNLSAMTATRCLMIRRAALLAFLSRHPAALQRMLELLASAAVLATNSLSSVAFDDIGHRVAGRLLEMADTQAEQTADGLRLTPRL
ncbi:MAG TPA: cyclic nucleotide-binding domain-containing protein, partial [Trueperaceae bacterium]|nr:cyclic nucleotide-binding domain-containing protein [Trueperaceae bacterium]